MKKTVSLFSVLFLIGCAGSDKEPYDPLEKMNRGIYSFNSAVEKNVMRPVAKGYKAVVPEWGRNRVLNFFKNLGTPIVFINDVLQGEMRRAGESLYRFVVNTTFGLGGVFDVADEAADIKYHSEDFGQTLAVWGVGEGPYITVPFLYPMPVRDLAGKITDILVDPVYEYPPMESLNSWEQVGVGTGDVMTLYAEQVAAFEMLEKTAMDPYAMTLSVLSQKRFDDIQNGRKSSSETDPKSSYEFEMDFEGEESTD